MKKQGITHHIITSLDDIAWITNMRGWDMSRYPVMLAYLILTLDGGVIFVDKEKLNDELIANFEENHIEIKDYNDIYEYVKTFDSDAVIMLDSSVVNYAITQNLNQNIKIEDRVNPSQLMKAMKNEIELENNRKVTYQRCCRYDKIYVLVKDKYR